MQISRAVFVFVISGLQDTYIFLHNRQRKKADGLAILRADDADSIGLAERFAQVRLDFKSDIESLLILGDQKKPLLGVIVFRVVEQNFQFGRVKQPDLRRLDIHGKTMIVGREKRFVFPPAFPS